MTQRVRIDSNGGNPFIVTIPGVDVSNADFVNTIFDANQSPLRVVQNGIVTAPVASGINVAGVGSPAALAATPSGTFPCLLFGARAAPLTGYSYSATATTLNYHINNSVNVGATTQQIPPTGQGAMWGYSTYYGGNVIFALNFQSNYTVGQGGNTTTYTFGNALIAFTALSNYG